MILTAPILLTFHARDPRKNHAIVIQDGAIIDIGSAAHLKKKYPSQRVSEYRNAVLLPGLVNTHTHLELPPLLDQIRTHLFSDWVLNLIAAKKKMTQFDYVSAVKRNIAKLVQTGTTTVGEICTEQVSSELLKQSGVRSLIFYEVISMRPLSSSRPWSRMGGQNSLVQPGLSPHAPHTVSEEILRKINLFAIQKHIPVCMHVAESIDEINLLQRKESGFRRLYAKVGWDIDWAPRDQSPFLYLNKLGLLGPRFLAVHAVHSTAHDIELIRKTQTRIAHCPRSNKETSVGRMCLKKFINAGIVVGLGTDSLASSSSLNMWDEMRFALKIHKRDRISAEQILRIATIGGATALSLDQKVGTLEPGKRADVIAVQIPVRNTGDLYADLIRETDSTVMTMVNGKILHRS